MTLETPNVQEVPLLFVIGPSHNYANYNLPHPCSSPTLTASALPLTHQVLTYICGCSGESQQLSPMCLQPVHLFGAWTYVTALIGCIFGFNSGGKFFVIHCTSSPSLSLFVLVYGLSSTYLWSDMVPLLCSPIMHPLRLIPVAWYMICTLFCVPLPFYTIRFDPFYLLRLSYL